MSNILQKIYDDIEDYYSLCEYFNEEPNGQLDFDHKDKLRKRLENEKHKRNTKKSAKVS